MSIKIVVKEKERQRVAELGARLAEDGMTWIIPDEITDINPFMSWLPDDECHIVQRPYFAVRAKCNCWKCGKETTVRVIYFKLKFDYCISAGYSMNSLFESIIR